MQGRTTHLLEPKRSILAGLVKFLAVGCGFNEVSPPANIESSFLADSMAVYLTPQASQLKPAHPTPSPDKQNSGGGSPGGCPERPGRPSPDKPNADAARG